MSAEDQERWLDYAEANDLTCAELRAAIQAAKEPVPTDEPPEEEEGDTEKGLWLSADGVLCLRISLERIANALTATPISFGIIRDAVEAAMEVLEEDTRA